MALRIGIDLGGSKIEGVVLRLAEAGHTGPPEVLCRKRIPTERSLGYQHILDAVAGLIVDVARDAGLPTHAAELPPIGVGMPGSVTRSRRTVKNSNTTCLNGQPFREDLIARVGRPIAFSNDANCFALSEARDGAGQGARVVFGVILGTGVGGGLVIDGRLINADAADMLAEALRIEIGDSVCQDIPKDLLQRQIIGDKRGQFTNIYLNA